MHLPISVWEAAPQTPVIFPPPSQKKKILYETLMPV